MRRHKESEKTIDRWVCGKGDHPRPVDKKKYDANYERIFGKKEKKNEGNA